MCVYVYIYIYSAGKLLVYDQIIVMLTMINTNNETIFEHILIFCIFNTRMTGNIF